MLKPIAVALTLTLGVAGCTGGSWKTDYTQLDPATTANWRVADVQVTAPQTLTTSEENTYTPNYDVVWHGEPLGDRRAQAAAIVREGIKAGTGDLHGGQPVVLAVTLQQFHALTPLARGLDGNVGVHDIRYTVSVVDAASGQVISGPHAIQADKAALVGTAAAEADAKGYTQKVEIVNHLAAVTRNWLGNGPDPRGGFERLGR